MSRCVMLWVLGVGMQFNWNYRIDLISWHQLHLASLRTIGQMCVVEESFSIFDVHSAKCAYFDIRVKRPTNSVEIWKSYTHWDLKHNTIHGSCFATLRLVIVIFLSAKQNCILNKEMKLTIDGQGWMNNNLYIMRHIKFGW